MVQFDTEVFALNDIIRGSAEKLNISLKEVAKRAKISEPTLHDILKRNDAKASQLQSLADVLGITLSQLIGENQSEVFELKDKYTSGNIRSIQPNIKEFYKEVPFASLKAQAGIPESYEGCQLDWINETYPVYIRNHIANKKELVVEVDGDSMTPGIVDGAIILAEAVSKDNIKYESGGIYAVLFGNGRFVIKRIKTNTINSEGILRLWSDNETYGHIDVQASEIHCMWKVVGKVWEPMK